MAERIVVVGLPTAAALPRATLYAGGRRNLESVAIPSGAEVVEIGADLEGALATIAAHPGIACVLASGDPGFFGVGRALAARFGPSVLEVRPSVSSVSLAFARLGVPWDDAMVVSAHGRPLVEAARCAASATKAAVLVSPASPPEALGKELLALGATAPKTEVAVCSRLGLPDEQVTHTNLEGLASGIWDPLSIVVLLRGPAVASHPRSSWGHRGDLYWGRPEDQFEHRGGMVTKGDVRAIVLAKLELPGWGVVWDVGAGSGSVGIECALLCPSLRVFAVEQNDEDAERIAGNARRLGAEVTICRGSAPACLAGLPPPDRVFVGGGGLDVLDAALDRLVAGGRLVATFAALDRAAAAAERLGALVQVATSRGEKLPDGGWRLVADNPVFVVWGPQP
ncbi:MAG: precorrin-6y C5,15-methyltransferase (decarboxylating) subunit CbiE [Acidimicrobiales bacterium]